MSAAATYERIRQACNPITGLSDRDLEGHIRSIVITVLDYRGQIE